MRRRRPCATWKTLWLAIRQHVKRRSIGSSWTSTTSSARSTDPLLCTDRAATNEFALFRAVYSLTLKNPRCYSSSHSVAVSPGRKRMARALCRLSLNVAHLQTRALRLSMLAAVAARCRAEGVAQAQELTHGGFDLRLFRHAVDSKGLASVNGTDILGHKSYSFGLILDGAFHLVPFQGYENSTKTLAATPIAPTSWSTSTSRARCTSTTACSTGSSSVRQLPIIIASGANVQAPGQYNDRRHRRPRLPGHRQPRFHAKWRILRMETAPIGLAAIMQVGLPTGDRRVRSRASPASCSGPRSCSATSPTASCASTLKAATAR